jgi:ribulose-phosphate 3-epimerase
MSGKNILAPSILSVDFLKLGQELAACESAGADWIHVDIMDGAFVPNISVGPLIVEACRRGTKLPLDVHLMIEQPERHVESFVKVGADRLTVHVEACPNLRNTLEFIQSLGVKAGVTLKPSTPATILQPVLSMVDLVLVMTVNPGFGGQTFMPETLPKVAELRRRLNEIGSSAWLEVDGGVSVQTIPGLKAAGANVFVSGNSVFKHPQGAAAGVRTLRAALS